MSANFLKYALLSLVAASGMRAAAADTYVCSLEVRSATGKQLFKPHSREIQVPEATADQPFGVEVFADVAEEIRDYSIFSVYFYAKTSTGAQKAPRLDLGIFLFNKLELTKRKLYSGVAGDARTFAEMTTKLGDTGYVVQFDCRNKNYF